LSDVTWYPEGGFYEQRSGQGEDPWADAAEFDAISCPSVDVPPSSSSVAWSALTAPASQKVESYSTPNPDKG
jgi:hypothetical protein